jgi:hypothetical protein
MERLETLVIARLRALRADIKMRGTGDGAALAKFEVRVCWQHGKADGSPRFD